MGGVHYDQVIEECEKIIRRYGILVRRNDAAIRHYSALVNSQMDISSGKMWRTKEKVSMFFLNPNYPQKFLYLRAMQGHSGSTINPALQDNVLLPSDFTRCIYHVGDGKELRSMVNHGLIPRGVNLKQGREAVFFTFVNPMDNQDGLGETLRHLSQARIALFKNTSSAN